ncbi:MAG TPA: CoA transferase [Methylomirabilota bacterium]|jgi:crotonobetainyl-CoA:carnitine CoA-transferase CaiB-like acyl-CoA transferase
MTAPALNAREGHGPLTGVTVLDLSGYVAGPYGCTLLGDLGAHVIKIEPPEGDNLRNYPSTLPDASRAFLGVNRNKRGIGLDLKRPDGLEVLRRLVARADVLVHNFRPSVPARLGIDYEAMKAVNPRLIYCALTGYGERGPLRDRAGYDQVLQTMSGICVEQGKPGDPEIVYGSAVDFYAASMLAFAVCSALYERSRSGVGRQVGVSLLRSALAMQATRLVWAEREGRDVARDMRSGGITGLHPTRTGHLYLSANTPHFWKALCELTGLDDLADDPRYDTVRKRAQHADVLVPRLREALRARTAVEWEAHLGERVPCAAARPVEDMFEHPQVAAEGILAEFEHERVGRYRGMAHPVHFPGGPAPAPFTAPELGQDSRAILADLGYAPEDIERLCRDRAVIAR